MSAIAVVALSALCGRHPNQETKLGQPSLRSTSDTTEGGARLLTFVGASWAMQVTSECAEEMLA